MVSHDKKKHPALRRKGKSKIVETIIAEPVRIAHLKNSKSGRAKKKHSCSEKSPSVVSAFLFNNDTTSSIPVRKDAAHSAGESSPLNAYVFSPPDFNLTFANELRNVIEYAFECLRDSVSDQAPVTPYLERSIAEMKTLCGQAQGRCKDETIRRLRELIEETEAFIKGEKTSLTNSDEWDGALHYRHYVRIAWLTHFILGDLSASGL